MTQDLWLDILDNMEPDLIERAVLTERTLTRAKRRPWLKWASAAACLLLCVGTLFAVAPWQSDPTPVGEAVTIPMAEVNLATPKNGISDMDGLFIYQGMVYRHFQNVSNEKLVGDYVCTVTGTIDEWTKADGYVELAGTCPGDVYAVKGYDPSFMLCQVVGDSVSLFINRNGLTLYTGKDWYGDRFHLRGNYESVTCQTKLARNQGVGSPVEVSSEYRRLIRRLVDALYDAPFLYAEDAPLVNKVGGTNVNCLYRLSFELKDGIKLNLTLYRDGYVTGASGACIKLDETLYTELLTMLEELCDVPWYYENGDFMNCTGADIFKDFYHLPKDTDKAEVVSKAAWSGSVDARGVLDEEGMETLYRLIEETYDIQAVHQDEMLESQGWERYDDGMWYWVDLSVSEYLTIILHEGGWVTIAGFYPLTFRVEGNAFDDMWALCETLTGS